MLTTRVDYILTYCFVATDGIPAARESRDAAPKGLGDFQRRSNRDRGWMGKRDYDSDRDKSKVWDTTPLSEHSGRDNALSVRVPNIGWDSTPRSNGRGEDGPGWGRAHNRSWDAVTPRAARGGSPDDGVLGIDAREWEEEQTKLDRDWYTSAEESGVVGDEEHNPLAQYEDLSALKEAEIATKQVVSLVMSMD